MKSFRSARVSAPIRLQGVRQNNLKDLHLTIPTHQITVITGVSGSGKSSLAFDTLYAEGQRRYIETFSPYARQFLDRMDQPDVDKIERLPPAIAIQQTNTIRNSRSTVGTMTELTDLFKLLFARFAKLYCQSCGEIVQIDTPSAVLDRLPPFAQQFPEGIAYICFPVTIPDSIPEAEYRTLLVEQGFTKTYPLPAENDLPTNTLLVIQDRFRLRNLDQQRTLDALQSAFHYGKNICHVLIESDKNVLAESLSFSMKHHCARCHLDYETPQPHHFSFNSPIGACESCKGFGRVIGIDYQLVIPDGSKTLRQGAIKPWQTPSFREAQEELMQYALRANIRVDTPWDALKAEEKQWVIEGTKDWKGTANAWKTQWYGVQRFFDWLESKAYKMHIRVLLSKYRSYTTCPDCQGARLKPAAQLWRVGDASAATAAAPIHGRYQRFRPVQAQWSTEKLYQLPGLNLQDLLQLPLDALRNFLASLPAIAGSDDLLQEIRHRIEFLCQVGLPYLTLDRQSRTLSGGEVQRINLITALGTSLVNTLFVLDEPSIGLHPKDSDRIIQVMHNLRDRGNTLVVVEHDPQFMFASDQIIDMGPGPGKAGGECTFQGTPTELMQADTLTAKYLRGELRIPEQTPQAVTDQTPCLLLQKASEHNLKNIDIQFPLERLVTITGVSGSGKSTLIQDVLYPALCRAKGIPCETPLGQYQQLLGHTAISAVQMVDQSPLGKTTRSNPVSYVGAYDLIRKYFATTPESIQAGYTATTFSFNSGTGRCVHCKGTGFEHIEMQFLSDVYIRCAECDGTRFTQAVREIRLPGHLGSKSIHEVLELTVAEAMVFFKDFLDITHALSPLMDVGLEYLQLGQPVPTLSGGEAQRLKLAGHLAEALQRPKKRVASTPSKILFLFDEPTTGLHFADIAQLLATFRRLVAAGHSLIIIEHNLDVIAHSDWIIDLGPEGGDQGGKVVFSGSPQALVQCADSYTGQSLKQYLQQRDHPQNLLTESIQSPYTAPAVAAIQLEKAREHNLKNISLSIPHNTFTVITGVSGSGKSTIAFDILFNEGQRRYLDTLNAYARSMVQPASKPDIDAIHGIPPTVAIEQRTSRGGLKSTVATMTEVYHFLRLLYVKLGTSHCPDCQVPVTSQSFEHIVQQVSEHYRHQKISILVTVVRARKGLYTDLAKTLAKKGIDAVRVDGAWLPTKPWARLDRFKEHTIEVPIAQCEPGVTRSETLQTIIQDALEQGKGIFTVYMGDLPTLQQTESPIGQAFSTERNCPVCAQAIAELEPRLFSYNSSHGWCKACLGNGRIFPEFNTEESGEENHWLEADTSVAECPECQGQRLNPVARAVQWKEKTLPAMGEMSIHENLQWFQSLTLNAREQEIGYRLVQEILARITFLIEVGLGYLTLNRSAPTLSGGEAQRIRLAAQLGTALQGVCYVLDEPSIGLHPRDNHILLEALHSLQQKGNTVVVVEHDEETIRAAEHIIDIGPGAGIRGGEIVAQGTLATILEHPTSLTARYLREPIVHPYQPYRAILADHPTLNLSAGTLHNIQNLSLKIPLHRLCVVTGVSGSGKSTLVRNILLPNLQNAIQTKESANVRWEHCQGIEGWQSIQRILEVDQTPIGKTPRSCPATYVGFWDEIRKLFANSHGAKMRGWNAARFSFNTGNGRCHLCQGQGYRTIEMNFLPDVKLLCEQCHGQRFNADTLSITYREKSIGDILLMDVDTAVPFFENHPKIQQPLMLMQEVGLGYLTLGQASPTLSGGEAQRLKLVFELNKARIPLIAETDIQGFAKNHTLYILDEPSVGLSTADIAMLLKVLHRLVQAGHSLIIIEHHLDIIAEADWLMDLGPEGGQAGGQLVHAGTLESFRTPKVQAISHTAQALTTMPH